MATGILEVLLVSAKGLRDTDFIGDMDPYVLIQYKGQERKSSVAKGQGETPIWNEKFEFKAEYPGSGHNYKITLKIFDKDTFSSDDFIGEATIYVEDLLSLGAENGSSELNSHKYRIVKHDKTYNGEILVGVKFTRKVENENGGHKFGGWKESHF